MPFVGKGSKVMFPIIATDFLLNVAFCSFGDVLQTLYQQAELISVSSPALSLNF